MKKNMWLFFVGFLSLCLGGYLSGCGNMLLLNPKGPIGDSERFVITAAFLLMLIVVIPVFIMAFWFARKYRASNPNAVYAPKWSDSAKIDFVVWLVPIAIVAALAYLTWTRTHELDPFKPIASDSKTITIEAVSLDWKWLFIYPEHNIASVNELVFPANFPLSFKITSDTVMTSFFIPQLGSQIYAMPGHQTQLHLMAYEPGTYDGHNQQFSGRHYADMNFKAIAVSPEQFEQWIQKARHSEFQLDQTRFKELAKPSAGYPVTYYSSVKSDLFKYIMHKYVQHEESLSSAESKDRDTVRMTPRDLEGS